MVRYIQWCTIYWYSLADILKRVRELTDQLPHDILGHPEARNDREATPESPELHRRSWEITSAV